MKEDKKEGIENFGFGDNEDDGMENDFNKSPNISPIKRRKVYDSPILMKGLPKPPEESFTLDKNFEFDSQNENQLKNDENEDEREIGLLTPKKPREKNLSLEFQNNNAFMHHKSPDLFDRGNKHEFSNILSENNNDFNNHNSSNKNFNNSTFHFHNDLSFNSIDPSKSLSRYDNDLLEIKKIGQTYTSSVFQVKGKKDGCKYAVKIVESKKENNNEIHVLSRLKNTKYLLRYYCCWEEQNHIYIQTEFCEDGSLRKMFKAKHYLDYNQLLKMIKHVSKGLSHLHKNNLCHRDIKVKKKKKIFSIFYFFFIFFNFFFLSQEIFILLILFIKLVILVLRLLVISRTTKKTSP